VNGWAASGLFVYGDAIVRPVERSSTAADSIQPMACGHPGRRRPGLHEQLHKFAAIFCRD